MLQSHNIIPSHLIAVPNYDGYFFCSETDTLYSLKVTGTLTPLTRLKAVQLGYRYFPARFNVSRNGKKSYLSVAKLRKLARTDYTVPFERKNT